jgi:hypothetical protein
LVEDFFENEYQVDGSLSNSWGTVIERGMIVTIQTQGVQFPFDVTDRYWGELIDCDELQERG